MADCLFVLQAVVAALNEAIDADAIQIVESTTSLVNKWQQARDSGGIEVRRTQKTIKQAQHKKLQDLEHTEHGNSAPKEKTKTVKPMTTAWQAVDPVVEPVVVEQHAMQPTKDDDKVAFSSNNNLCFGSYCPAHHTVCLV